MTLVSLLGVGYALMNVNTVANSFARTKATVKSRKVVVPHFSWVGHVIIMKSMATRGTFFREDKYIVMYMYGDLCVVLEFIKYLTCLVVSYLINYMLIFVILHFLQWIIILLSC